MLPHQLFTALNLLTISPYPAAALSDWPICTVMVRVRVRVHQFVTFGEQTPLWPRKTTT